MEVIEDIASLRGAIAELPRPIGLVPTMGSLHAGHMALVDRARTETRGLVVSIFVNPAQFGPSEDFQSYPRDAESDLAKLNDAGVDLVFTPSVEEIYPPGFDTYVDVGRIGERLEGEHRPGHFRGVATVVYKLLAIVRPARAYFGEKDFQQSRVVTQLAADLNLGSDIVAVPTVREPDGLALSSRNVYLDSQEREAATVLYKSLSQARDMARDGVRDARAIRSVMHDSIQAETLATVDYISVADESTLDELDRIDGPARALVAVRIGKTRLIDNMSL